MYGTLKKKRKSTWPREDRTREAKTSTREGDFAHLPLYFFHSVLATYPRVYLIPDYRTQEEESKRKERKEKEEKESNIKKEKKEKINKRERKKKKPHLFYALPHTDYDSYLMLSYLFFTFA